MSLVTEGSPCPEILLNFWDVNGQSVHFGEFTLCNKVPNSVNPGGHSPPPWVLLVQYPLMSLAHLPNNFRPGGNKISWSKMRGLLTPKSNKVFSK